MQTQDEQQQEVLTSAPRILLFSRGDSADFTTTCMVKKAKNRAFPGDAENIEVHLVYMTNWKIKEAAI